MAWLQIACWLPQLSFRSPNTNVLHWSLHNFSGLNLSSFEFEDWFISDPMGYGKESGKSKMLAMQLIRRQRAREGETNRKQKQQENLKQLLEVDCSLIILKQSNSFFQSPESVFFCLVACAFLVLGFVMVITWMLLFIGKNMFVCFSQHLNLAQARLLLSLHEPPPNQVPQHGVALLRYFGPLGAFDRMPVCLPVWGLWASVTETDRFHTDIASLSLSLLP